MGLVNKVLYNIDTTADWEAAGQADKGSADGYKAIARKNIGAYKDKTAEGGIPEGDLHKDVKDALAKARSAVQGVKIGSDTMTKSDDGMVTMRTATTSLAGVVQLNSTVEDVEAEDETTAATPKLVKLKIGDLDSDKTSTDGTNVQVQVKQVDGKITDVKITSDKTVNSNDVGSMITDALADYSGFEIVPLNSEGKPQPSGTPSTHVVYLTREETSSPRDPYTEWIYIAGKPEAEPPVAAKWEIIGETSVDLKPYVKFTNFATNDQTGVVKSTALSSDDPNRYYGVNVKNDGTMQVNVPWITPVVELVEMDGTTATVDKIAEILGRGHIPMTRDEAGRVYIYSGEGTAAVGEEDYIFNCIRETGPDVQPVPQLYHARVNKSNGQWINGSMLVQPKLVASTNISIDASNIISATDTKYTADNKGISLTGTVFSVKGNANAGISVDSSGVAVKCKDLGGIKCDSDGLYSEDKTKRLYDYVSYRNQDQTLATPIYGWRIANSKVPKASATTVSYSAIVNIRRVGDALDISHATPREQGNTIYAYLNIQHRGGNDANANHKMCMFNALTPYNSIWGLYHYDYEDSGYYYTDWYIAHNADTGKSTVAINLDMIAGAGINMETTEPAYFNIYDGWVHDESGRYPWDDSAPNFQNRRTVKCSTSSTSGTEADTHVLTLAMLCSNAPFFEGHTVGSNIRPVYVDEEGRVQQCSYAINVGSLVSDSSFINFV